MIRFNADIESTELKIKTITGTRDEMAQKREEYNTLYMNADIGLANGYVDDILKPSETRKRLFEDLVMLEGKTNTTASYKKHGNIPL